MPAPQEARLSDLRERGVQWEGWDTPEHVFEDGWRIISVTTREELKQLGKIQGHCSERHHHWTEGFRSEYFFVLCDDSGVPHYTFFCKKRRWIGRPLPKTAPQPPTERYDYAPHVGFNAYDEFVKPGYADGTHYLRDNLKYWERDKARLLEVAKQFGPLGPEHPYKQRIDEINRRINTCRTQIEAASKPKPFPSASLFTYCRKHLVLVQQTGRGLSSYEDGGTIRHQERFRQWVDTWGGYMGLYDPESRGVLK